MNGPVRDVLQRDRGEHDDDARQRQQSETFFPHGVQGADHPAVNHNRRDKMQAEEADQLEGKVRAVGGGYEIIMGERRFRYWA